MNQSAWQILEPEFSGSISSEKNTLLNIQPQRNCWRLLLSAFRGLDQRRLKTYLQRRPTWIIVVCYLFPGNELFYYLALQITDFSFRF